LNYNNFLLAKPFEENLGSLVLGGKWASYILLWKKDTGTQVHPLNLHQKLVFQIRFVCQARKSDCISNETGDIWLS
jgi:hypothetical protein